ncbi:MAG TPA: oligosaccharide flippase family protein [Trueperaceae bacterium]|nr:oligosaccharide flippase family protein [Trueperaceae bacterium]
MTRLRNVGMLAVGTAAGHVVSVLAAPLLTRIYSPADFGLLSVFTAMAAIAGVAVSLRLELAVAVPADDGEGIEVVLVGVMLVAVMAALAAVVVTVFGDQLSAMVGEPDLRPLLAYLPLYLGSTGIFNMLNFWFARESRFAPVAALNTMRGILVAVVQYVLGLLRSGAAGLVAGHVAGPVVQAVGALAVSSRIRSRMFVGRMSWGRVRSVLRRYRTFILYGTPQALVNAVNQSLPALVLTTTFNASIAGFYLMAHRLVSAPVSLVGRAVRQVIYPQLARALEDGDALRSAIRTTLVMAAMAVPAAALVFVFGPDLFAWLLGPRWRVAGEFARWLILWLAVGFVNIPSVSLIPLLNMQRWHVVYEVIYLVARFAALLIGAQQDDAQLGIVLFAMVGVTFNLVLIYAPLKRLHSLGLEDVESRPG